MDTFLYSLLNLFEYYTLIYNINIIVVIIIIIIIINIIIIIIVIICTDCGICVNVHL